MPIVAASKPEPLKSTITVALTFTEKTELSTLAKAQKVSVSALVRSLIQQRLNQVT
jgi:post-segregation antitoxin (ccd killing protein)